MTGESNSLASTAWATPQGIEMRAGFVAGCARNGTALIDCGCVFAKLTSRSPYDTPAGFTTLLAPIRQFEQTGNLGVVPGALLAALRSCRR